MPDEYYNMMPADFEEMINGHVSRIEKEGSDHRRAAFLVLLPHVKKLSYEQFCKDFWPLSIDKVIDHDKIEMPDKEYWNKVMAIHNKGKSRYYRNKKKHK